MYLESFAKTLGSREQLAIAEFADALLVIPKTLAVNAGKVCDHPGGSFAPYQLAVTESTVHHHQRQVTHICTYRRGVPKMTQQAAHRLSVAASLQWLTSSHASSPSQDATELVSRLASFHYTAQTRPEKKHYAHYGLDLVNGVVRDNVEACVLEPVLAKVKIVQVRSSSTDLT